jgi:hypothetical protein
MKIIETKDRKIIETKDSLKLRSRLYNWKFKQAQQYLKGQPEYVKNTVNALAIVFGNIGWEDDIGVFNIFIENIVENLLGEFY